MDTGAQGLSCYLPCLSHSRRRCRLPRIHLPDTHCALTVCRLEPRCSSGKTFLHAPQELRLCDVAVRRIGGGGDGQGRDSLPRHSLSTQGSGARREGCQTGDNPRSQRQTRTCRKGQPGVRVSVQPEGRREEPLLTPLSLQSSLKISREGGVQGWVVNSPALKTSLTMIPITTMTLEMS